MFHTFEASINLSLYVFLNFAPGHSKKLQAVVLWSSEGHAGRAYTCLGTSKAIIGAK